MHVLLAIYTHPEYYPPTINAAEALAAAGHEVTILCSNHAQERSRYEAGISVVTVGDFVPLRAVGQRSTWQKIRHWLAYTARMWRLMSRADVVLAYDTIPLLSYRVARCFLGKKPRVLWYHNHDVIEMDLQRKYSISWLSARNEPAMFPRLDVFSLPAEERKTCFPMEKLRGQYVFLPNFPALRRYDRSDLPTKSSAEWRVIFQGSIGPGHGIEAICRLLPMQHAGRPVKLLLKGFVHAAFRQEVEDILAERGASHAVEWLGVTAYEAIAQLTATCHVGIAIFEGQDVMNRTLGTASNKIYEYAACGVPIVYADDAHYRAYLGQFAWALPTDGSPADLERTLRRAFDHSDELAGAACRDFREKLHFERYFTPALHAVLPTN
jgi:hypothetical protein